MAATVSARDLPDRKAAPPLSIIMSHSPPDNCLLSVADQSFALPRDDIAAATALRALRKQWTTASIGSTADTPYRCTAAVILVAQQAGFKQIGFVSAAPRLPPQPPAQTQPKRRMIRPR